jgi:hypothetical protein
MIQLCRTNFGQKSVLEKVAEKIYLGKDLDPDVSKKLCPGPEKNCQGPRNWKKMRFAVQFCPIQTLVQFL